MPKSIALIGGGPACMIAAYYLSDQYNVTIYEQGKAIGRKFLVAGNGGFNLTNAAKDEALRNAYSQDSILLDALKEFDSGDTRNWLAELGIDTFIGSSGRVFPEGDTKPVEVLKKIKAALKRKGVNILLHHRFVGFDQLNKPLIQHKESTFSLSEDKFIFGLGGASWSKTGSNQDWLKEFEKINISTVQFASSNCGIDLNISQEFLTTCQGTPLKNISLSLNNHHRKGEAVITKYGLEGNAVYPLIPAIRERQKQGKKVVLYLDLKPNNTVNQLKAKIIPGKTRTKNYQYVFNLTKIHIDLVKLTLQKDAFLDPYSFVEQIKKVPLHIDSLRPIEEAISTVGGIDFQELNDFFWSKKHPKIGIIGEMINWDAPTGGYLLQACFSSGVQIARSLLTPL
jgi:uncharacterized flavoprotein (TIGR03862 family)